LIPFSCFRGTVGELRRVLVPVLTRPSARTDDGDRRLRNREARASGRCGDRSGIWRVLLQPQMRPTSMVVVAENLVRVGTVELPDLDRYALFAITSVLMSVLGRAPRSGAVTCRAARRGARATPTTAEGRHPERGRQGAPAFDSVPSAIAWSRVRSNSSWSRPLRALSRVGISAQEAELSNSVPTGCQFTEVHMRLFRALFMASVVVGGIVVSSLHAWAQG
jgi:hypothetical protein